MTRFEVISGAPLLSGTFVFWGLGLLACIVSFGVNQVKPSPHYRLGLLMITITTICLWLMWFMAWIHQWHPVMLPVKNE